MRIQLEHTFPCTPSQYVEMLQSDVFEVMLERETGVHRVVVETSNEGPVIVSKTLCTPDRELPTVIAKAIGSSKLIYDQFTRLDTEKHVLEWRIVPKGIGDRVDIHGRMTIVDHPEGCKRVVSGEVVVKVRFIGGQIEKAVVADVERNYHKSAAAIRQHIVESYGANNS